MQRKKLLCILTTLLGNKTTSQYLREQLSEMEGIEPTYVFLEPSDYQRYPAPAWARLTNPWQSEYIARRKAAPYLNGDYDGLIVNGWELVIAFADLAERTPAAALMDAIPTTFQRQLIQRTGRNWKRDLSFRLHQHRFGRAASKFSCFLPMGSDCRAALRDDYGIPFERCRLTLAPQNTDLWKPADLERPADARFRLLLVTNDFVRKGGDFLLSLFSASLQTFCSLTIVSNDPALEQRVLPEGARWIRGCTRDQVLELYRDSDLFVFPTRQDFMPQVIAEALATGLPCVAADVGGVGDLVLDGRNGYLMQQGSSEQDWVQRIRFLFDHPEQRQQMAREARAFAETNLTMSKFRATLMEALDLMFHSPLTS